MDVGRLMRPALTTAALPLLACAVVAAPGCAEVRFEHESEVDFVRYRTATLAPIEVPLRSDYGAAYDLVADRYDRLLERLRRRSGFADVRAASDEKAGESDLAVQLTLKTIDVDFSVEYSEEYCSFIMEFDLLATMTATDVDGKVAYRWGDLEGHVEESQDCEFDDYDDDDKEEAFDEALEEILDEVELALLGSLAI